MVTDTVYINMYRKSFKTHEKYVRYKKSNTYGYIKEIFGIQCLLDIAYYGNKIETSCNITDIEIVDKESIPDEAMMILNMESEWEWMENYFKDIID